MKYVNLKKNDTLCIIGGANIPSDVVPMTDETKDKMYVGYAGWSMYNNIVEYGSQEDLDGWESDAHIKYMYFIDIHTRHTRKPEYISFLKCFDHIPVLMQLEYSDINSYAFPRYEIIEAYGIDYFMCSMSYMVAWAMFMKYKRIELYNISMTYDDDLIQRYNFEYWLGRATQAGIEVVVSEQSGLLKAKAYGYEVDNTLGVYMQKHLSMLKVTTLRGIESAINSLTMAKSNFLEANFESIKFNREILHRHEIDIEALDGEER